MENNIKFSKTGADYEKKLNDAIARNVELIPPN